MRFIEVLVAYLCARVCTESQWAGSDNNTPSVRTVGRLTGPLDVRRLHLRSSGDVSLGDHRVFHARAAEEAKSDDKKQANDAAGDGVPLTREHGD